MLTVLVTVWVLILLVPLLFCGLLSALAPRPRFPKPESEEVLNARRDAARARWLAKAIEEVRESRRRS